MHVMQFSIGCLPGKRLFRLSVGDISGPTWFTICSQQPGSCIASTVERMFAFVLLSFLCFVIDVIALLSISSGADNTLFKKFRSFVRITGSHRYLLLNPALKNSINSWRESLDGDTKSVIK